MPYLSAYPRPGQVALLCEGDVIGYEATLFQKWTGAELGNDPLVDIWCCGTSSSMFGISDAIGRSRPIFVIEDRDFRTIDEARDDCAQHRKDRESRAVKIISWEQDRWVRAHLLEILRGKASVVAAGIPEVPRCEPWPLPSGRRLTTVPITSLLVAVSAVRQGAGRGRAHRYGCH
jgi:hypothetical protein